MRCRVTTILTYPHELLKAECAMATPGQHASSILDQMEEAMREHGGIGLAANQIGHAIRLVVVESKEHGTLRMINPRFLSRSGITIKTHERCLSIPDFERERTRPYSATVRYTTDAGAQKTVKLKGIESATISHEIDHLNGRTIIDG
jgi:peptide deformylase